MTKAAILHCIEELESKLEELRTVAEKLPEEAKVRFADTLASLERKEGEEEADDLNEVFATLRAAWDIPPDVKPDRPLEELQKAMAEGLPENWASRELLRMREE